MEQVVNALMATLSPQDAVRKPAEDALREGSNQRGFVEVLVGIIRNEQQQATMRLAAVINLKRTVANHWKPRKVGAYTLGDDEKAALKQFLLSHMEEPDQKVAAQLAVLIADIARKDWPRAWDELFPSLMASVHHQSSDLAIARSTYTLLKVLKMLSTKRLTADRQSFVAISIQLYPVVSKVWEERSSQLLNGLGQWVAATPDSIPALEQQMTPLAGLVMYLVKCLYHIVMSGFPNSMQANAVGIPPGDIAALFEKLMQHEQALVGMATNRAKADQQMQLEASRPLPVAIAKMLYRITLIAVDAQQQSSLPFRPFLRPFLALFYDQLVGLYGSLPQPPLTSSTTPTTPSTYPATPTTSPPLFERLARNAINFLANVVGCEDYRLDCLVDKVVSSSSRAPTGTGDQEMTTRAITEAASIVNEFFNPERSQALLDMTMHTILPLRTGDLEEWTADAEVFHHVQISLKKDESPRAAAEVFLMKLVEARAEQLAPLLAQMLQDSAGQQAAAAAEAATLASNAPALPSEVLIWDARYLTAGLCATQLRNAGVDYNTWFLTTLAPALTALMQGGGGGDRAWPPVLRRRILWVMGQWMVEVRDEIRPALYQALVQMLESSGAAAAAATGSAAAVGPIAGAEDAVVSLTLMKTLNAVVDSWDFKVDVFRPLTGGAVGGLYAMLFAFQELDSRLQVMELLHLILEHVGGEGILTCVDTIVGPLRQIWDTSADDLTLLRKRVLNILTLVVGALGSVDAARLNPLVIPMLQISTDMAQPQLSDYLMEDGLELWAKVIVKAPEYTAELHALFPHIHLMLQRDLGFVQQAMQLLESYVVLGAGAFLDTHAGLVTALFEATVDDVSPLGANHVARAIETLLRRFPVEGAAMLRQGGVLTKLMQTSFAVDDASGVRGLNEITVKVLYLSLLARVMFTAPDQMALLLSTPPLTDGSPQQVLGCMVQLVDLWIKRFDAVGTASHSGTWGRKLVALALVSLLPSDPQVLQRLHDIVNICVDVIFEQGSTFTITGSPGANSASAYSAAEFEMDQASAAQSDQYTQKLRAMLQADPVHTTDLRGFLQMKMGEAQGAVGDASFQQALSTVDPALLQQLQSRPSPGAPPSPPP